MSNQSEHGNGDSPLTDPTRKDAGHSSATIRIVIELNPITKTVQIADNTGDPILFYGILEQAKQIYAQKQMDLRRAQLVQPKRPLVLPPKQH